MIAAFSTSGPQASVALLSTEGEIMFAADETARSKAGEVCLQLLEQALTHTGSQLSEIVLFAADLGPGSFTGVRVGIVLAKTLAWQQGARCLAADAFDLVDPDGVVALPSRKGEWFVRIPGSIPKRTQDEPTVIGIPFASGFSRLAGGLKPLSPYELVPAYLLEPSISKPKEPFRRHDAP